MIKDIVQSIQTYFKAIKLVNKINLWKYFLIPIVLGLILGLIFISTAISLSNNFGTYLSDFWPFEFGKGIVTSMSSWIAGFLIIILSIILYKHTLMVLAAPFMTPNIRKSRGTFNRKASIRST